MIKYSEFRPTQFDHHIAVDNRENWLVAPVSHNRDSGPLDESNFRSFLSAIGGEGESVEVYRFGHWGPDWFEIIIINPDNEGIVKTATEIENALADYPVVDESDFYELETETANDIWEKYYNNQERIEYIRKHRSEFDFNDFLDLWHCVKGEYFCGYASELID